MFVLYEYQNPSDESKRLELKSFTKLFNLFLVLFIEDSLLIYPLSSLLSPKSKVKEKKVNTCEVQKG